MIFFEVRKCEASYSEYRLQPFKLRYIDRLSFEIVISLGGIFEIYLWAYFKWEILVARSTSRHCVRRLNLRCDVRDIHSRITVGISECSNGRTSRRLRTLSCLLMDFGHSCL